MADDKSWLNIGVTVVALGVGALWAVTQTEFGYVNTAIKDNKVEIVRVETELKTRLTLIEARQIDILSRLAHDPVESKTFDSANKATDDKVNLLQSQITDINRQIAAALIIIDQNAGIKRNPVLPP